MLRKDIALRRPLLLADRTWHLRLRDWPEVRVAPGETAYRAQLLVSHRIGARHQKGVDDPRLERDADDGVHIETFTTLVTVARASHVRER